MGTSEHFDHDFESNVRTQSYSSLGFVHKLYKPANIFFIWNSILPNRLTQITLFGIRVVRVLCFVGELQFDSHTDAESSMDFVPSFSRHCFCGDIFDVSFKQSFFGAAFEFLALFGSIGTYRSNILCAYFNKMI